VLAFNRVKELFSNLFFGGENYIVLEILNHYIQATILKANLESKKIRVTKNWTVPIGDFNILAVLDELKPLLKKIRRLEKYKVILSLDSSFAATIYALVPLVRQHPRDVIDEADLDNLISQAIWRFFDKNRFKVAQKLGIDEVDVLLGDIRVRGIKIDGHKVVNPIGFKAKAVEIFFSQTLIGRQLMRGIRDLIPKENIIFMTETGTAMSHVLSKSLGKDNFFLANLFPNNSAVFSVSNGKMSHHDDFKWGEDNIRSSLSEHFAVDNDTAGEIVGRYVENNISQNFSRRFETVLGKELQTFANGLESLIDKDSADIYLNPFFAAPPLLYADRFKDRMRKSFKLMSLSTNLITENLGYEVHFNKSVKIKNIFTVLAVFLELNFLPQNDKMSHLANRRVRWLVT